MPITDLSSSRKRAIEVFQKYKMPKDHTPEYMKQLAAKILKLIIKTKP